MTWYLQLPLPVFKNRLVTWMDRYEQAHSRNPLHTFPRSKSVTSWRLPPKALSTLSQKSATVAENGETTATVAEFGDRRTCLQQLHFSATVWTGLNKSATSPQEVNRQRARELQHKMSVFREFQTAGASVVKPLKTEMQINEIRRIVDFLLSIKI